LDIHPHKTSLNVQRPLPIAMTVLAAIFWPQADMSFGIDEVASAFRLARTELSSTLSLQRRRTHAETKFWTWHMIAGVVIAFLLGLHMVMHLGGYQPLFARGRGRSPRRTACTLGQMFFTVTYILCLPWFSITGCTACERFFRTDAEACRREGHQRGASDSGRIVQSELGGDWQFTLARG
jgi:hypothetical protein